jgi:hypothetical protein
VTPLGEKRSLVKKKITHPCPLDSMPGIGKLRITGGSVDVIPEKNANAEQSADR